MQNPIIDLFTQVCAKLEQLNLTYMLTGSAAMSFYALSRTTQDLDIVIELKEEDLSKFLEAFPKHYFNEASILTEIAKRGMFNLIDHNSGYKIDFILRKNTKYAQLAFSRRIKNKELGADIWVIAIEDLIIAKLQWIQDIYSDRQMNDIQNLLLDNKIDMLYLKNWIAELRLNTFQLEL
jgi:hypothetical protein